MGRGGAPGRNFHGAVAGPEAKGRLGYRQEGLTPAPLPGWNRHPQTPSMPPMDPQAPGPTRPAAAPLTRILLLALLALLTPGCSSWQLVERHPGWSLHARDGAPIDAGAFRAAAEPALASAEELLGPFRREVRIHAWEGSVDMRSGNRGQIVVGEAAIQDVPGIGPAKVQAFHARAPGGLFGKSGVFVGVADPGTILHELVHAHFEQHRRSVPLWFEEGVATFLGDGLLHGGRWTVDGLACWPWRELSGTEFSDAELERLLAIRAEHDHTVQENVLVHFVGWAIVFDLARETGSLDWEVWLERFRAAPDPLAEARRRLARTLAEDTPLAWLERLDHPDPAVRLAAAKGTWKLHSRSVALRLVEALRRERDSEVRVGLAVNALAAAGEMRLGWRVERQLWPQVLAALRDAELADPAERAAARALHAAYARFDGTRGTREPLTELARFWQE